MEITKYTLFLSNCRNIEKYGNKKKILIKILNIFKVPIRNSLTVKCYHHLNLASTGILTSTI